MSAVEVTRPFSGVAQLTLNRPDQLNVVNAELISGLTEALDEIGRDAECRVVMLTGAGRGFSAGLDLNGYGDGRSEVEPRPVLDRQREIAWVIEKLHRMPQPVIAAVNGPAAGGGLGLACAADIRIASASAIFKVSFITAGYSACDVGVSWLLPRIVGAARAHELMLTGRRFDAAEAERIGFVARVVQDDELLESAFDTARLILANAPVSVELTKEGMWLSLEAPSLRVGMEIENRQQVVCALTRDSQETRRAFVEKRPPNHLGR